MCRGMFRGMFRTTGYVSGYVSRYVSRYVAGYVSEGSYMPLFMNSAQLMERPYGYVGFRVCKE